MNPNLSRRRMIASLLGCAAGRGFLQASDEAAPAPLFRDPDGLAASSRNSYLSPAERASALALSEALAAGCALAAHGSAAVLAGARAVLDAAASANPPVELDYLVLVDARSFTEAGLGYRGAATLLVAAKVGRTRLIDNISLEIGSAPS